MSGLLRCSVASGIAALMLAAQPANAGEILTAYSTRALEKLAGKNVIVRDQPRLVVSIPAAESRQQTLVLNCEKIEQSRRGLDEALKRGADFIPVAPGASVNASGGTAGASVTTPASGAEIYHILQNQRRMDALSQKFNCDAR